MRVLGISGSLREGSYNTSLLRAAADELPPGTRFELYDGLAELPPFNQDDEVDAPPAVLRLREEIGRADAVLVSTPEYNASVPGVLKNAVDWASRPFPDNALRGKPVAVIGASTGIFGAVWAQAELRKSLRYAGAHVLDEELAVGGADQALGSDGRLRDPELHRGLKQVVAALAHEVAGPLRAVA